MVWETTPTACLRMMTQLGDLLKGVASSSWLIPPHELLAPAWGTGFEVSVQHRRGRVYVMLVLWPELTPATGSCDDPR